MTTRLIQLARPALLLAALLVAAPALRAQTPTEGYDPMRQITAQLMKANLHIVQDVTGSMTSFPDGPDDPSGGVNGFGYLTDAYDVDSRRGTGVYYKDNDGCATVSNKWQCRYWYYALRFDGPSRMGIVKNALGSSVPLVTAYTPPSVQAPWSLTSTNPNTNSTKTWHYRYDFGLGNRGLKPAAPFATPYETITIPGTSPAWNRSNFPIVLNGACTVGTCTYYPPQDLIGKNAHRVNWGLTTYSESATTQIYIDTTDANSQLASLKDYFLPSGATGLSGVSGLGAGGYTNTREGLKAAKTALTTTANADPKITRNCDRPYGVILVTDGLSNNGNTANGNWISPCGTGYTTCDPVGRTSGIDCPSQWGSFPAYWANELYKNTNSSIGVNVPVRTWTIGVSAQVGPCELDFVAYMGRTDASSPGGDAGWGGYDPDKNPYIPGDISNPDRYDGPTGQYKWYKNTGIGFDAALTGTAPNRAHGHNAFFATSAEKLGEALTTIVNATGTGDYATNAPVSGMAASLSSIVYLPSTEFPSWKGHLYAFDTNFTPSDPKYLYERWDPKVWNPLSTRPKGDAAEILNEMDPDKRRIFTWNPTTLALIPVEATKIADLVPLGGAGFTTKVIDFIRGKNIDVNGNSTIDPAEIRTWKLGPLINSAPALAGPPSAWLQGTTITHKPFESTYATRDALLWAGSNTGMMHAFRIKDGVEQIALIPPSLLATQVELYQNYFADQRNPKNQAGQPADPDAHLYGVANSFRYGDVWAGGASTPTYRTIGVITVGPGGDDVIGVDVTTVPKPDASPYPSDPIKILWKKDPATMTGLQQSWSIPAMAPAKSDTWRLIMGSGFNPGNTAAKQVSGIGFVQPNGFTLDPMDGSLLSTVTLNSTAAYTPFVGSQAFADTVLFNPTSKVYQEDNVATLGLQADLNGQIWFLTSNNANLARFDSASVGINASAKVGQSQPIYYNPAASGYGQGGAGCVAYAFGSGTLYERSTAITGSTKTFVPRLYVATTTKASYSSAVPAANIIAKPIRDTASPWKLKVGVTVTDKVFGVRTQLTAPPFMLVPKSGKGSVTALFLLYDPDEGCHGNSYVAVIDFIGSELCLPANLTYTVYDAGAGAASGFTIAGDKVLVSKSGIGEGQRAGLYEPPGIAASVGGVPEPKVKWWKELK